MQKTREAEILQTTETLSQTVQIGEWLIDGTTLGGDGTPIDEVLARGGTFYGREVLNAWRFLPPTGWRLVYEDEMNRVYAAPEPGAEGEWAVAPLKLESGVWRAGSAGRNLRAITAGTSPTKDLELVWPAEQVIVRGLPPQLYAKVKNTSNELWSADGERPLEVIAWLLELPSNRRLLASRDDELPPPPNRVGKTILVPPGAAIEVPVRLATIAPESLVPGTYGIIGRLERLSLTSTTGTVVVIER
ncbi:MAG TPA: hypothetical protein VED84_08415 [Acidimicrobiales bacterium]|nr:hypothetical protein [Acidimicrobiales bacterium]